MKSFAFIQTAVASLIALQNLYDDADNDKTM